MILFASKSALEAWRLRAETAEARLDSLLARVADPEVALALLAPAPQAAPQARQERTYIPDTPDGDEAWYEHRGIEGDDDVYPDASFILANEGSE